VDSPGVQPSKVSITYGIVPKDIEEAVINARNIKLSKREFCLYIKGVAKYYVTCGSRIIVEPEEQSDIEEVKVYILGSCFGALLAQRGVVAIHGGSIVIDGQGIVITGQMGAGKSTLTSAFRNEGHLFLGDDVSALGKNKENRLIIHPTYPQAKLCRDAMEKMGYDTNRFRVTDSERDKFAIPVRNSFYGYPVILNGIYEINVEDVDSVELTEVSGTEKLSLILKNIYRVEISNALGFTPEYFKSCIEIAQKIPVYRIVRPKEGFTVDNQINLIKSTIKESMAL
jgi:hypothetical protein